MKKMKKTPHPKRTGSIRRRIGGAMVVLVVVTLIVTGWIVVVLQDRSSRERIDSYLLRTRDEFVAYAATGKDPDSNAPFADPGELLGSFLSHTFVDENAGAIGIVEGQIRWFGSNTLSIAAEQDKELMKQMLPLAQKSEMSMGTFTTSKFGYRYHVAPIKFPTSQGALVHVYNLDALRSERDSLLWIFLLVGIAMSLLSAAVTWLLIDRIMKPVDALRVAAESIGDNDLTSRVPTTGNDDMTRLSRTINRMLDRLQTSVETQRRLLDDVGHELRTPITIVRGHLELMDRTDPEDVSQTRDLAIDELDRMGHLVGDLLVLAKANQSDFVQPEWFSLAALTDSTLEKARALGKRQWRLRSIESVDGWLDPNRITQAWLQLAANAVKYSAEDSPITLGCRVVGEEVHFLCEDQGVGIKPEELDTIRSRFGRGSNAGSASGAGLGLSIVESIVAGHHGRLEIESEPGVGSKFTIIIPISPKEDDQDEHDLAG
ncbi:sensor histidine kinase [Tessaracoccus sp. OH4464_COT-324]|nr:sensor histidine kinase [Tessaracoccus sp. OH4464_COT-324]